MAGKVHRYATSTTEEDKRLSLKLKPSSHFRERPRSRPHRHLLAKQIRPFGMTNHPPTGYPSSLRLLNKFKSAYPLEKFVTHEFPVDQVDKALAQAFDIDACMKVVLTPSDA
jgi:threonine dehydrogenase-like Zn-dependent dehydrogenase